MASDRLKKAIEDGEKLIAQGDDADPAEVQRVLRTAIQEDPDAFRDAMRSS